MTVKGAKKTYVDHKKVPCHFSRYDTVIFIVTSVSMRICSIVHLQRLQEDFPQVLFELEKLVATLKEV